MKAGLKNTKEISSGQIAMAFTGSFLGAGVLSGQELKQFFSIFGTYGIVGMILSVLLFFVFSCFVMIVAKRTGITEFDKIIVKDDIPWLRMIFSGVFIFFLFSVVVVMTAGTGALLNQVFGIPLIVGNIVMVISLGILSLWESRGVLAVFTITVPFLIVGAVASGILSFLHLEGASILPMPFSGANPLLGNWFFSAIAFVSYNMMVAISILVPIAKDVEEEKTIYKGLLQGSIQLIIVFTCILLPLIFNENMLLEVEIPMLTLAEIIDPILGIVYAFLLLSGMFGSSLSCIFGVTARIRQINIIKNIPKKRLTLILSITAFLGSIIGFSNLIGTIFPICGYISFFGMIGISKHFLSLIKDRDQAK